MGTTTYLLMNGSIAGEWSRLSGFVSFSTLESSLKVGGLLLFSLPCNFQSHSGWVGTGWASFCLCFGSQLAAFRYSYIHPLSMNFLVGGVSWLLYMCHQVELV